MYSRDYSNIYKRQEEFMRWFQNENSSFYLTGGTALSRFYLNHRFSDGLDYFSNLLTNFDEHIQLLLKSARQKFRIDSDKILVTQDFVRFFIENEKGSLKIEFVNDVEHRVGNPIITEWGLVDTVENILSNKVTALMGRDEPKDVFDIISISKSFSFSWKDVVHHAKQKAVFNEIDLETRLTSFPVSFLSGVNWLMKPIDVHSFSEDIEKVSNDILLARHNSLGLHMPHISNASVNFE